jgi:hypothetical protein
MKKFILLLPFALSIYNSIQSFQSTVMMTVQNKTAEPLIVVMSNKWCHFEGSLDVVVKLTLNKIVDYLKKVGMSKDTITKVNDVTRMVYRLKKIKGIQNECEIFALLPGEDIHFMHIDPGVVWKGQTLILASAMGKEIISQPNIKKGSKVTIKYDSLAYVPEEVKDGKAVTAKITVPKIVEKAGSKK